MPEGRGGEGREGRGRDRINLPHGRLKTLAALQYSTLQRFTVNTFFNSLTVTCLVVTQFATPGSNGPWRKKTIITN